MSHSAKENQYARPLLREACLGLQLCTAPPPPPPLGVPPWCQASPCGWSSQWGLVTQFFQDPVTLPTTFPTVSAFRKRSCRCLMVFGLKELLLWNFWLSPVSPVDCDPSFEIISPSLNSWWGLAPKANALIPSVICSFAWKLKSPGTNDRKKTADPVSCLDHGLLSLQLLRPQAHVSPRLRWCPWGFRAGRGSQLPGHLTCNHAVSFQDAYVQPCFMLTVMYTIA